jgi:hypothetical protein
MVAVNRKTLVFAKTDTRPMICKKPEDLLSEFRDPFPCFLLCFAIH